jgi:hypothetical protein
MPSCSMMYPNAPTTFEEIVKLIPKRGKIERHRFMIGEKPFELTIGRNDSDFVFMQFGVPHSTFQFFPTTRTLEGMQTQRQIWAVWEKFMTDPDDYLTWKRFEVKVNK